MAKFKVGDFIIGNDRASAMYAITVKGTTLKVDRVLKDEILCSLRDRNGDFYGCYSVNPECFDLLKPMAFINK